MKNGFVYVLSMKNGKYYVGSSDDLARRVGQHQDGKVKSTKHLVPIGLLYSRKYDTLKEARQMEYWLKKQKDRKQIERFMQGPQKN